MNFEILLHLELNSKTTKNATHTKTEEKKRQKKEKTNFVVAKNTTLSLPFKLKTSVKVILLPELFLEEESNSFV